MNMNHRDLISYIVLSVTEYFKPSFLCLVVTGHRLYINYEKIVLEKYIWKRRNKEI